MNAEQAAKLREPFADSEIGKLPRDVDANGNGATCKVCGKWHKPAKVHLDYVGHAAITNRLLQVDPEWTWEPFALDADGTPAVGKDSMGNLVLWIRLTVAGVTRIGVGTCEPKKVDPDKQLIGDALRNAAMRFGVALDLWSKEDLARSIDDAPTPEPADPAPEQQASARSASEKQKKYAAVLAKERGLSDEQRHEMSGRASWSELTAEQAHRIIEELLAMPPADAGEPTLPAPPPEETVPEDEQEHDPEDAAAAALTGPPAASSATLAERVEELLGLVFPHRVSARQKYLNGHGSPKAPDEAVSVADLSDDELRAIVAELEPAAKKVAS